MVNSIEALDHYGIHCKRSPGFESEAACCDRWGSFQKLISELETLNKTLADFRQYRIHAIRQRPLAAAAQYPQRFGTGSDSRPGTLLTIRRSQSATGLCRDRRCQQRDRCWQSWCSSVPGTRSDYLFQYTD
jgi:hypothetical protein